MARENGKPDSKIEKILTKLLNRNLAFPKSQGDIEALQSIRHGTYRPAKPEDPSFRVYASHDTQCPRPSAVLPCGSVVAHLNCYG